MNGKADTVSSPIVPGHEIIGHVAAVGDGVSGWKVGDRIGGAWHGGHDGESDNFCRPNEKVGSDPPTNFAWCRYVQGMQEGVFPDVRQRDR